MTKLMFIFISILATAMMSAAQSQKHAKYSVITIEYVGESDKPITPIVISDSEAGAAWCRGAVLKTGGSDLINAHVVNDSLLKKLISDVDALKGTLQQKGEKNLAPSKTVAVRIITPERNDVFLYETDSAISLLETFQKSCGKRESLATDLAHFRDRIRAWKISDCNHNED
jgi:hypothetical protein